MEFKIWSLQSTLPSPRLFPFLKNERERERDHHSRNTFDVIFSAQFICLCCFMCLCYRFMCLCYRDSYHRKPKRCPMITAFVLPFFSLPRSKVETEWFGLESNCRRRRRRRRRHSSSLWFLSKQRSSVSPRRNNRLSKGEAGNLV